MNFLYLDIETIPTTDEAVAAEIERSISPPGNISKAETIAAWEKEKRPALVAEAIAKTALSGLHGHICCIGWAWNESEPQAIISREEAELISRAFGEIGAGLTGFGPPVIVGHNLLGFDLRFIWQRAFALGVSLPGWVPRNPRPWDDTAFDTMQAWSGPRDYVSLDSLAKALGLPGKTANGSDVAGMWQRGEFEAIATYCKSDIEITRNVHRKMRLAFGEAA